jgi:hypothetical protein
MLVKTYFLYILGVLLAKAGCGAMHQDTTSGQELLLTMLHYKVPCVGESIQLCFKVKTKSGDTEFFYDAIEGFTYEWGYNYTLLVEKSQRDTTPADGSTTAYTLKKIVRKEKVASNETFELPLELDGQPLIKTKDGRCTYFGAIEIETGTRSCNELIQARSAVFRHDTTKQRLVLVVVR